VGEGERVFDAQVHAARAEAGVDVRRVASEGDVADLQLAGDLAGDTEVRCPADRAVLGARGQSTE
jgi:hypothetical protein